MDLKIVRNHRGQIAAYELQVDQEAFLIRVRAGRPRQKRIVLRADERGFSVSAPRWAPWNLVEKVIRQNVSWLRETQAKTFTAMPQLKVGDEIRILGQPYVIRTWAKTGCDIDHATHIVWVAEYADDVHAQVYAMLRELALKHLPRRAMMWAENMALRPSRIGVKAQRSRWGSCTSKGHIYLNWRLIQAPEAVVDYVVIHELAHLAHMNHGPEFWKLVERFMPNWQAQRTWLRLHGSELFRLDPEAKP
ncbi:M48 family metallopeptidase [Alicyclobacillus acidocaldarius]|uniref:YgjP-like metallopeptidase domain-containing protein n=1 Tax=Alicyclobacillus acidocaldarius (strain Tc-4-1) TaxID=1048834 RepID=F8IKL3_ALIAT|nr:SprT family zinc-dependent metalloprotease [Alicyclobacillus acidocaldarius]AEJ43591.1 protein of unknown function DUF45 [Alicyclobacillus acidocaldarius subsp. acidocaldarius Tc-4-1]